MKITFVDKFFMILAVLPFLLTPLGYFLQILLGCEGDFFVKGISCSQGEIIGNAIGMFQGSFFLYIFIIPVVLFYVVGRFLFFLFQKYRKLKTEKKT
jgi:hypothetical protein